MQPPPAAATTNDASDSHRKTDPPRTALIPSRVFNQIDLYAYLSGPLGRLEGVQHVESSVFLRRVKQLTYQRPPR